MVYPELSSSSTRCPPKFEPSSQKTKQTNCFENNKQRDCSNKMASKNKTSAETLPTRRATQGVQPHTHKLRNTMPHPLRQRRAPLPLDAITGTMMKFNTNLEASDIASKSLRNHRPAIPEPTTRATMPRQQKQPQVVTWDEPQEPSQQPSPSQKKRKRDRLRATVSKL